MKTSLLRGLLSLVMVSTSLHATVPCGNSNSTGTGGGCSGSECPPEGSADPCQGSNKFNVYTGNASRSITDLVVNGAVTPLMWTRYANTRYVTGSDFFGQAGGWRHEYQWTLASAAAVNGAACMVVTYPDGSAVSFLQQAADTSVWLPPANVPDILRKISGVFVLQRAHGERCEFETFGSGSAAWHRLKKIHDTQGNALTMGYSSSAKTGLLTTVIEAAGRSLQINWTTLNVSNAPRTSMCNVPYPFASEDWQEIPRSAFWSGNPGWRAIILQFPFNSSGYLAEVEFYDMNGAKLAGTPISSGPTVAGHDLSAAFDGDPSTYVQFLSPTNDWLGMDFGPGVVQQISKIRYRAAPGYASKIAAATFAGVNTVPGTVTVIDSVQSSTGLSVSYAYSNLADSVLDMSWAVLTGALYGDNTQSIYTVAQMYAGSRPLITGAVDPRYAGAGKHIKYVYNPEGSIGFIDHESDGVTGEVIATLAAPQYSHIPVVTKSNGATATYVFKSSNGVVLSTTDGLGRKTSYTQTAGGAGFVASRTDPLNRVTSYTRSPYGNILTETLPDGQVTTWTRDDLDLPLTRVISGPGIAARTTTWTRDAGHRVTRLDHPDGTYEEFTYNSFGQPLTHRKTDGGVWTYAYDARGLKTSATDPLGAVSTFAYNANDRLSLATDPLARATAFGYDDRGAIVSTTYADGSVRTVAYDDYGNKTSETDELGHVTTYAYDHYQRLVSVTDPLGRVISYGYGSPAGGGSSCSSCNTQDKPTSITQPDGTVTKFTYDSEWQLVSKTEAFGTTVAATTAYVYDKAGNVTKLTDPLGHASTLTYDARNRPVTRKDALNRTTNTAYDLLGNVLTVTRADGQITAHAYDLANRRTSTTDALSQVTAFGYDAAGRLTTLTDPRGSVTTWSYDAGGRLLRKTYADSTYEENTYDVAGQRTLFRTPAGVTRACAYDLRGRELTCDWSDATPDLTRAYDLAGRLTSLVTAGVVTHTYAYDAAGQLLSETSAPAALAPATFTVSYTYDTAGRRSQLTYPDAGVIDYAYTARGQVSAISADGPPPLATFAYDLDGQRVQKVLENGTTTTYAYDAGHQVTTISHANASGEFARFAYTYDTGGRRTAKTITGSGAVARAETYGYDAIDQVTLSGYGAAGTETFAYDAMGNRTSATLLGAGTVGYAANNLNQYTNVGGVAPTYDTNGNTLTIAGRTLAYDGQSRLTSAAITGHAASFIYDGRNRQVSRTVDGVTTWFVWDNWSLLAEYQLSGGTPVQVARYVHGPRLDEILVQSRGVAPTPVYLHEDALGSTYVLTDSSGSVVERYSYTGYGEVSAHDNAGVAVATPTTRFLYTGREWILELGLGDHRNRLYMPSLGRWVNRDPIGERGGINLFVMIGNNYVNDVDPTGLLAGRFRARIFAESVGGRKRNHPDNSGIGEMLSDPAPHCFNEGWFRHCVNSCRLQLVTGMGWMTQAAAQASGHDLPWDPLRDEGDVAANQQGIDNANSHGRRGSCVESCRTQFFNKIEAECCSGKPTFKKNDACCKE